MRTPLALLALAFTAAVGSAHYNMLLPDKPWANKEEKVTFTYQFGHPFEHELFDAPKPAALVLITPKGQKKTLDIDKTLTKIELPGSDGKKVTAWQFAFTPAERGDHTFVLKTPKIKIDKNEFVEDTVRVVLHVQTQNGWSDTGMGFKDGLDILPVTRPYGLLPGMVFQAGLASSEKEAGPAMIEFEKYNPKPLKKLPSDELITFRTLEPIVIAFPEPGWWGVTGIRKKDETLRRATMWIHVDEKK